MSNYKVIDNTLCKVVKVDIKGAIKPFTTKIILVFNIRNLKDFRWNYEDYILDVIDEGIADFTIVHFVNNKTVEDVHNHKEISDYYGETKYCDNFLMESFYRGCTKAEMLEAQKFIWKDALHLGGEQTFEFEVLGE